MVNAPRVVVTAVNRDGRREILGLGVVIAEDGRAGSRSCEIARARGLRVVESVVSDAHPRGAIDFARAQPRGRECRTHFTRTEAAHASSR